MTKIFQTSSGLGAVGSVLGKFPRADAMIVSALATQELPLMKYLAQTHDLTTAEVAEAMEAFLEKPFPEPSLTA